MSGILLQFHCKSGLPPNPGQAGLTKWRCDRCWPRAPERGGGGQQMRTGKYHPEEIAQSLRQAEAGTPEVCESRRLREGNR